MYIRKDIYVLFVGCITFIYLLGILRIDTCMLYISILIVKFNFVVSFIRVIFILLFFDLGFRDIYLGWGFIYFFNIFW